MSPVTPSTKRVAPVRIPEAMISGTEKVGSARATAAIDFMGWTGMGTP